jgi:hypothetical protein
MVVLPCMNHPLFGGYSVDMLPYSVCFYVELFGGLKSLEKLDVSYMLMLLMYLGLNKPLMFDS